MIDFWFSAPSARRGVIKPNCLAARTLAPAVEHLSTRREFLPCHGPRRPLRVHPFSCIRPAGHAPNPTLSSSIIAAIENVQAGQCLLWADHSNTTSSSSSTAAGGFDDSASRDNLKTWSQAFARELEGELRGASKPAGCQDLSRVNHRPRSRRRSARGPDAGNSEDEIGAAGLLTVLMSPHYLLSKWCADERNWWVAAPGPSWACHRRPNRRRPDMADRRRALAAALVDARGQPLVGFTFYEKNAAPHPWPHEWPDPTGAPGPFRKALLRNGREDMAAASPPAWRKRWRNGGGSRAEADRLTPPAEQIIYLHGRTIHAAAGHRAAAGLERTSVCRATCRSPTRSSAIRSARATSRNGAWKP